MADLTPGSPHRALTRSDARAPVPSGTVAALSPSRFEELFRSQWSAVVNYLRFRIGPAEAQDAAADIFTRAWERRAAYDPQRGEPAAWLWGIARTAAREHARVQSGARGRGSDATPTDQAPHSTMSQFDSDMDDASARAEALTQVAAALLSLDDLDRDIVALRFGAGLSHREVGRHVGLTAGNTAVRLHRAIRHLRQEFDGRVVQ